MSWLACSNSFSVLSQYHVNRGCNSLVSFLSTRACLQKCLYGLRRSGSIEDFGHWSLILYVIKRIVYHRFVYHNK